MKSDKSAIVDEMTDQTLAYSNFHALLFILIGVASLWIPSTPASASVQFTGVPVPGMESFDRTASAIISKWNIPGAALAVTKDGRLVFAHGYGYADIALKQLVQPDSLFRIASISKPITAVTILKLVEQGKLSLDSKVFQLLGVTPIKGAVPRDARIMNVTVRELLQHSGGWDRDVSFDPMFIHYTSADVGSAPLPASCETIIRFMMGKDLDFAPGSRYAYSNFGYCILGRVIEKVTGEKYDDFVRTEILAPMGIIDMRIGHTSPQGRAVNEVHYYDYPGAPLVASVFPGEGSVPSPYGGFYLEALDSHGGWAGSTIDLVRFAVSIDGVRKPSFLTKDSVGLMLSRPSPPLWVGSAYWYGMGWMVRPVTSATKNWWHTGSLPGTMTILVRTYDGMAWAAFFNTRPKPPTDDDFMNEVDSSLWDAAGEVTSWPTNDMFSATPVPELPFTFASVVLPILAAILLFRLRYKKPVSRRI